MVLEPVAVTAVEKKMKEDTAPEKRVELHLHTTMSSMDALTSVGPKLGPDKNVVKRAEAWGHPAIAITDHGVAHSLDVYKRQTNTRTDDVDATLSQIRALATAGCDIVPVSYTHLDVYKRQPQAQHPQNKASCCWEPPNPASGLRLLDSGQEQAEY